MKDEWSIPNDFHNVDIYNNGDVYINQPIADLLSDKCLGNLYYDDY
jgi:hypothetical protein